jgi:hypothetical protein
LVSGVGIVV